MQDIKVIKTKTSKLITVSSVFQYSFDLFISVFMIYVNPYSNSFSLKKNSKLLKCLWNGVQESSCSSVKC